MALPKSVCDNCLNTDCVWRAPTDGNDPPVMVCPQKIEKSKTNADRIRAMTDEELANKISEVQSLALKYGDGMTFEEWLDWLKQEIRVMEVDNEA
ncbi:MAG: hypothetical protein LIR46_05650 [Bacteroidota bacterium]|nr:hypothetical protein [Bacteroidota bacterium]